MHSLRLAFVLTLLAMVVSSAPLDSSDAPPSAADSDTGARSPSYRCFIPFLNVLVLLENGPHRLNTILTGI
ncbi:hypothetical protein DFH08DRAFT_859138 [Mycena albidolilacea]|uniref:Uncharacterized protein n=1 Tax=Mycena albidolilacea TaxID=1033008 RepID=A0AAD7EUF0_9AGAR|nr:hypothetical protein DFH08DRAFT_859138 [Mycena albidolilacea]